MFLRNATTYMTPSGLVDVYRRFEETLFVWSWKRHVSPKVHNFLPVCRQP